jgi:hypothetical protein
MRYVQVIVMRDGVPASLLDPEPYLRVLPGLELPGGAREFAMDPDHYDFNSSKCVKDLRMDYVRLRESGHAELALELSLAPNRFKHHSGLSIRYDGVSSVSIDADELDSNRRVWPESPRLGDLQLDEILPTTDGCSHEIKFTGGSITIVCKDLHAEWDPPER